MSRNHLIPSSPLEYSPAEAIPIGYFPPKPNATSLPQSYPYGYVPPQNFTLPSQPYVQASPLTNSEAEAKPSGSPDQPFVPALTFHPSFEVTPDGDIVSHDPVLNSNGTFLLKKWRKAQILKTCAGAALHRFILDRLHPPTIHLHLCGSHRDGDQTVKDFEFVIDLSGSLIPNVADMYTLADDEFVFRGGAALLGDQFAVFVGHVEAVDHHQRANVHPHATTTQLKHLLEVGVLEVEFSRKLVVFLVERAAGYEYPDIHGHGTTLTLSGN